MATLAYSLMWLAAATAVVAWVVGFVAFVRALALIGDGGAATALRALVAWPFATDRVRDRGLAGAATVNKALVVLIAAVALAAAFGALHANLAFLQSR